VLAIGLALLAASCWGVADFLGGISSREIPVLIVLLAQQAVGVPVVLAAIAVTTEGLPELKYVWLSLAAGIAGVVALGAFYRALAVGTMSIVAPISASGVTLPVIVGVATGDELSTLAAVGVALAVLGVVLASREAPGAERVPGGRQSIVLALLAGAGFGTYFALSDAAADGSILWLLAISRSIGVVALLAVLLPRRAMAAPPRDLWPRLLALGMLDLIATALYAIANTEGLLTIVAVVGSLYPIATVLLARVVLHERLQRVQAAGVVLAFCGVAAVAGAG
jgi:drug/metabolite transporter (DMT)-like permease